MIRRASQPRRSARFAELRVAAVVDEFTRASLAPEVQLLSLDARIWPIELIWFRPHFLFVESAWRGHRDGWKGRIASYPGQRPSRRLAALVFACKRLGIPTAFWNKEDPVHYDRFITAARHFDHVFTTAAEVSGDYERDCGAAATALPFAYQPEIYAAGEGQRAARIVFAGSYGESHFPVRRRQLEMLLDGALAVEDAELRIFDRNAVVGNQDKLFPDRFRPYIAGARDYRQLADEYRSARVGLNVNSVTDSTTMFSRRVVEMLACGLPVVSGPGRGMSEVLGDLVTIATTVEQVRDACAELARGGEEFDLRSRRGIEVVSSGHRVVDRLTVITERVLG